MPPTVRDLILIGFVFLATLFYGYYVGHRYIRTASGDLYQIVGISQDGNTKLGFACFCANRNGTKTWEGYGNDGCDARSPNKAIDLSQTPSPLFGYAIPGGACCKLQPRVGNIIIPDLPWCG
jgi:hypothetical protein